MNLKTKFLLLTLFVSATSFSQRHTISGYIYDKATKEKLINATVFDQNSKKGVISNFYGFYSLTIPEGNVNVLYSFVGYAPVVRQFKLKSDTIINIELDGSLELDEVIVIGSKAEKAVKGTQMGTIEIPMKQIQNLPVFLGEPDVIKALQLLPGVQSGSEGRSGLYVRGGGPDQNLILLDGVPVYNVNHLFGFFSVFNPDALSNVTLYKGSFPARYGGRLSSVLDIRMKEGDKSEYHGNFSIGVIASKFNLEGPIIKDKTSFIISARRTYIDYLLRPLITYSMEGGVAGYYFYDINAKVNHKINENNHIYFSMYTGLDEFYFKDKYEDSYYSEESKFSLGWGNLTSALRWNYKVTNKLFSNTTLTFSKFNTLTNVSFTSQDTDYSDEFGMDYNSGIKDISAKIDFDWTPLPEHAIKFGANYTNHKYNPGVTALYARGEEDFEFNAGNDTVFSNEFQVYFEDNVEITPRIKVNAGMHFSLFNVQEKTYWSVEPRISARYLITDDLSVKAAYTNMTQYIHLLSNPGIGLPTDLWVPVTKNILPQRSNQISAGIFYKLKNDIDFSIEGFYKEMNNIIDYIDGATFFGSATNWENKVAMGKGLAYGAEFLVRKNSGDLTGWIGYTLSWANKTIDKINYGKTYWDRYDRRHDISIVMIYKIDDNKDMGLTWVYGTGYPVTISTQNFYTYSGDQYDIPEPESTSDSYNEYGYYPERNNYRMPAYHRLDIGINFHKKKKHGTRTWSISAYNAYNRANPFMVFYGTEPIPGTYYDYQKVLKQFSMFPIIPSVSYKYNF